MDWTSFLSAFGGSGGGNSSGILTPTEQTQGGIGAVTVNVGGNPNLNTITQAISSNPWPWAIGAAAAALLLFRGRK